MKEKLRSKKFSPFQTKNRCNNRTLSSTWIFCVGVFLLFFLYTKQGIDLNVVIFEPEPMPTPRFSILIPQVVLIWGQDPVDPTELDASEYWQKNQAMLEKLRVLLYSFQLSKAVNISILTNVLGEATIVPMVNKLDLSTSIEINYVHIDIDQIERDSLEFKVTIRTRWEMAKLYMHENLLVDYAIFVDVDVVMLEDIESLWKLKRKDKIASVCKETIATNQAVYPNYFNSGMMVLNLKKMRDFGFVNKSKFAREKLRERDKKFWPPDQNIYNAFFDVFPETVEFVNGRYHMNCVNFENIKGPVLIHYCGMTWLDQFFDVLSQNQTKLTILRKLEAFSKCNNWHCGARDKLESFNKRENELKKKEEELNQFEMRLKQKESELKSRKGLKGSA